MIKKVNIEEFYNKPNIDKNKSEGIRTILERTVLSFNKYLSKYPQLEKLELENVEAVKYSDYINRLSNPCCIAYVKTLNNKGNYLINIDLDLAHFIIELMLGSNNPTLTEISNPLSTVSERMIYNVIEQFHILLMKHSNHKEIAKVKMENIPELIGYTDNKNTLISFNYSWLNRNFSIIIKQN